MVNKISRPWRIKTCCGINSRFKSVQIITVMFLVGLLLNVGVIYDIFCVTVTIDCEEHPKSRFVTYFSHIDKRLHIVSFNVVM